MSAAKRKREVQVNFRVSPEELALIEQKMAQLGTVNNLNQLTRKVHETGRIYDADLEDISQRQEQLWDGVQKILAQLSKLS